MLPTTMATILPTVHLRLPGAASGASAPLCGSRLGNRRRARIGLALVQPERRVAVGHQRRVRRDPEDPPAHAERKSYRPPGYRLVNSSATPAKSTHRRDQPGPEVLESHSPLLDRYTATLKPAVNSPTTA